MPESRAQQNATQARAAAAKAEIEARAQLDAEAEAERIARFDQAEQERLQAVERQQQEAAERDAAIAEAQVAMDQADSEGVDQIRAAAEERLAGNVASPGGADVENPSPAAQSQVLTEAAHNAEGVFAGQGPSANPVLVRTSLNAMSGTVTEQIGGQTAEGQPDGK